MKLKDFAELMGVSIQEAELLLKKDEVVTIDLSREKGIRDEEDKLVIEKV